MFHFVLQHYSFLINPSVLKYVTNSVIYRKYFSLFVIILLYIFIEQTEQ